MIQIDNLTFSYAGIGGYNIYQGLELKIAPGHIYGLLGKNGVGKSTLFRLITGVNKATSGTIRTLGFDPWERRPEMLREIFLIPEEMPFFDVDIVKFSELYGFFYPKFDRKAFSENLEMFEIPPKTLLSRMSQGQRKKAMIAFALACNTKILLLDEPTNGLDIPSKRTFRACFERSHNNERSVIVSTHQVRDLEELIDAVIVANKKKVVLNALVSELLERYRFGEIDMDVEAVYAETAWNHRYGVVKRAPGEKPEGRMDLEVLFCAAVAGVELMGGV